MGKIAFDEIVDHSAYERMRPEFRARVLALKDDRRVHLNDLITVFFENKETMRYQLQEMIRTERLVDEAGLREELDTWNKLIPDPGSVSMTFMIQEQVIEEVKNTLRRHRGIEKLVFLTVGDEAIQGIPEHRDVSEEMTAAVHYFRFDLSPDQQQGALADAPIGIRIDHDEARIDKRFDGATLDALRADLRASLEDA